MSDEWLNQSQFAVADGCDEKQVRRGLARGALVAREDGKLNATQVQSGWRRPRVNSREAPAVVRADVRATTNVRVDVRTAQPIAVARPGLRRADLIHRLRALDWCRGFDWSEAAIHMRVMGAAAAVGLEAVQSSLQDDGHWDGWQLRNPEVVKRHGGLCLDAIVAGHGYQLDGFEALAECRLRLDHPADTPGDLDDVLELPVEQLPLLAYPFSRDHQRAPDAAAESAWYANLAARLDRP